MAVLSSPPPDGSERGPGQGQRPVRERRCSTKEPALEGVKEYAAFLFPICPALRKLLDRERPNIDFAGMATNSDIDCIKRILQVCLFLSYPHLTTDTLVMWAHWTNQLKDSLDLIRRDLASLPKRLEKDYPDTSKKCARLMAELKDAEFAFTLSRTTRVFLLPQSHVKRPGCRAWGPVDFPEPGPSVLGLGQAGTLPGFEDVPFPPNKHLPEVECTPISFQAWQQNTMHDARPEDKNLFFFNLVNYYPARAVIAARELWDELFGVAQSLGARMPAAMTDERADEDDEVREPFGFHGRSKSEG